MDTPGDRKSHLKSLSVLESGSFHSCPETLQQGRVPCPRENPQCNRLDYAPLTLLDWGNPINNTKCWRWHTQVKWCFREGICIISIIRRERDARGGLFSLLQRTQDTVAVCEIQGQSLSETRAAAAWARTLSLCTNKKIFICVLYWVCCFVRLPLLTHTPTGPQSPRIWKVKKKIVEDVLSDQKRYPIQRMKT